MSNTISAQMHATEVLQGLTPSGATVYVALRGVSRSGMQRRVTVHCLGRLEHRLAFDGTIRDITYAVAQVMGWKRDKDGYLVVNGAQFDVATHVVGALSWRLYGQEYSLQPRSL